MHQHECPKRVRATIIQISSTKEPVFAKIETKLVQFFHQELFVAVEVTANKVLARAVGGKMFDHKVNFSACSPNGYSCSGLSMALRSAPMADLDLPTAFGEGL